MPDLMKWFPVTPAEALGAFLSVVLVYATILLLTRLFGLRSFSKMSTGDFAMTVAVGSLFGTAVANPNPTVGVSLVAFIGLFAGQWLIAWARTRSSLASHAVDNEPVLLMKGETILHDNMRRTNVNEADLRAKLREANVLRLEEVQAVVFETTGDISVLHSADPTPVEPWLLEGVIGGDQAAGEEVPGRG